MASRSTTRAAVATGDHRSTAAILRRLDERLSIIERAFQGDESRRADAARRWSGDRYEARRKAIAAFDYAEMLQRQPDAVKRLRDRYARLNAFLAERGHEPVQNEFTE